MSAQVTRREIPNNTGAQIREYLSDAEEILRERGYDPQTHEQLLCQVLGLCSGKQILMEQMQPVAVDLAKLRHGNGRL